MKRTKLNPVSKRREQREKEEIPTRKALCERAGGVWIPKSNWRTGGYCRGGRCEICGEKPDFRGLHPHEYPFKSHGGKLSLEDSKMACGECHSSKHGVRET